MTKGIGFTVMGIAVIAMLLISGCVQPPKEKVQATPNITATEMPTAIATEAPTPVITPVPTLKELPNDTFYVVARMVKPAYWENKKYQLTSVKAKIQYLGVTPISVKAQIVTDEQILEESSFILQRQGSSTEFTNQKRYFINSTNVTLRLVVQGYEPVEFKFIEAGGLS